jgi:hypothetical protein
MTKSNKITKSCPRYIQLDTNLVSKQLLEIKNRQISINCNKPHKLLYLLEWNKFKLSIKQNYFLRDKLIIKIMQNDKIQHQICSIRRISGE